MTVAVDAHQHYWDVARLEYDWRGHGLPALDRHHLPSELEPQLAATGITHTVLVQVLHSTQETDWLLQLAARHSTIAGVVGWVDLTQSQEKVASALGAARSNPLLVGIRHLVHEEPDDGWLVRDDVLRGLAVLEEVGVPFDLLLRPQHLRHVPPLSDRLPRLRMVIDHIAKPKIRERVLEPWASDLQAAAENPNVWCKLSGMITEANHSSWRPDDLTPYVQTTLRAFGPDRVMFGSDWPVCTLAGSYDQVVRALRQVLGQTDRQADDLIFRESAVKFYGLSVAD